MIQIVFSSIGMMIGESMKTERVGYIGLKAPRLIQVEKNVNGNGVTFRVSEIFGQPRFVELEGIVEDVHDEAVLRAYKESVTGLTLVSSNKMEGLAPAMGKRVN